MPRNQWTLARSKRWEYARLIKRMRAAGADLDASAFDVEWIEAEHWPAGSFVRSSSTGTMFGIYVRMLGLAPRTILEGFELSSPAWDFDAYFLDDPGERNSVPQQYRLLDGSPFDQSEILNHRVGSKGILRHGDVIEGLVLAECFSSAPICYKPFKPLPLVLWVVNQLGGAHMIQFVFPVERFERRIQPQPQRSGGLFEPAESPENGAPLVCSPRLTKTAPEGGWKSVR